MYPVPFYCLFLYPYTKPVCSIYSSSPLISYIYSTRWPNFSSCWINHWIKYKIKLRKCKKMIKKKGRRAYIIYINPSEMLSYVYEVFLLINNYHLTLKNSARTDRFPCFLCFCRVWSVWEDGILWDCIKPGAIFNTEAPWRHCKIFKQCHQLGWYHMDDTHFRCLHCRCSSWPILDFCHCIRNLYCGKFSLFTK